MTTTPERHAGSVTDLLATFVDLKSWLREVTQHHGSDQATSSLTALAVLERCGPARVGRLAETMRVDVSVVSRYATTLERAGLLVREPDPTDGRAHHLAITEAGSAALAAGRARLVAALADRLAAWSPGDLAALNDTLRRLLDDLTTCSPDHPRTHA